MAIETLYRLRCDEKDCDQIQGTVSESRDEARRRAEMIGWDLGPRHVGQLNYYTDYCPRHRKTPREATS